MNPSDINPTTAFEHTVLGSDVAGVVVDVGEDCERLKRGDTVFGDIGANAVARFSQEKTKELGAYVLLLVVTLPLFSSLTLEHQHLKHRYAEFAVAFGTISFCVSEYSVRESERRE